MIQLYSARACLASYFFPSNQQHMINGTVLALLQARQLRVGKSVYNNKIIRMYKPSTQVCLDNSIPPYRCSPVIGRSSSALGWVSGRFRLALPATTLPSEVPPQPHCYLGKLLVTPLNQTMDGLIQRFLFNLKFHT